MEPPKEAKRKAKSPQTILLRWLAGFVIFGIVWWISVKSNATIMVAILAVILSLVVLSGIAQSMRRMFGK